MPPPAWRRLLPWTGALLFSATVALGAVEATRIYLENGYQEVLATEATRRAIEITAVTMNGNVMGSVAALGLVNQPLKRAARGEIPLLNPAVMQTLQSVGELYRANGMYVVNREGTVRSCWYTMGVTLTGVKVGFRPYFQIAMQGRQNVYAAIGTTTGQRSLYFAAPVYDAASLSSPIGGAMVARLDLERVDSVLKAWGGPALLFSPQQIAFASTRDEWVTQLAATRTPAELQAIRSLKQFGNSFEKGAPKVLPFDIRERIVRFEGRRYAVMQAPVKWNDLHGDWKLVLLGDLDRLMPASLKAEIAAGCGASMLVFSTLFLFWRRRFQDAKMERRRAEAELKRYAKRLEFDSEIKSYLSEVSVQLQQAPSLAEFSRRFMLQVSARLQVDYGEFYLYDAESRLLVPMSGYGVGREQLTEIAVGQGLVGQCAQDLAPIEICDTRETTLRIVWGGGEVAPRSVLLLPVLEQSGRLLGVLVLAAVGPIEPEKRALLAALLPMVAMNLEIQQRSLRDKTQLETSRQLAGQLQTQQERIKETEAWYRGIIESAPDGMLVVDEAGQIILANLTVETIFGYAPGELPGLNIDLLVPTAARAGHGALRTGFAQAGVSRRIGRGLVLRGTRKDGSEFPVEIGLSLLAATDSHPRGICASIRDIS